RGDATVGEELRGAQCSTGDPGGLTVWLRGQHPDGIREGGHSDRPGGAISEMNRRRRGWSRWVYWELVDPVPVVAIGVDNWVTEQDQPIAPDRRRTGTVPSVGDAFRDGAELTRVARGGRACRAGGLGGEKAGESAAAQDQHADTDQDS